MRIGIITHWKDNDNYGAALQSYALQKYLRELGHEAFVIRFFPAEERHSIPQRIVNVFKKPTLVLDYIKAKRRTVKNNNWDELRDFSSFRERYIALSPVIYHGLIELQANAPDADLYITGSDQVWHGSLKMRENRAFFLDFGQEGVKRIAYSASFGRNYFPCEDEQQFKDLLIRFNGISMREDSGVKILNERGFTAIRCLDSTLLLDGEHYKSIMSSRRHKEKFAYFYTVNVSSPEEIYWSQMKEYFTKKVLTCVVTTGSGYKQASEMFDGADYDYATVPGWLSNIYNSEIVITASFHGIAFSLLLQKNFIYLPLRGKHGAGNDRVTDLLKSLGLIGRKAECWNDVIKLAETKIDYSSLDTKEFDRLLRQSKSYLAEATQE